MMDYHVHTRLCNHASGDMAQYVACAAGRGLSEIGFLEHLTLHEQGRHLSMTAMDIPLYYYAARRLQAAVNGQIRIRVGLEVDFTPELAAQAQEIAECFDFDMIGGSVHFIENRNLVSSRAGQNLDKQPRDALFDQYLDLLDQMADYPFIDIVCHLDVIRKFGVLPGENFYEKLDPILDKIAAKGKTVEVNTSGLHHPTARIYPDARILAKCREKNIAVCTGSDAHRPEQVGRDFDVAMAQLTDAGYTHVAAFDRKTRRQIPLARMTEGINTVSEIPKKPEE
ncbi:histidinol-phosphatase (PHP family) [Desulfosalsimonas propionicica]|uniref:Histidinol-phosphatase n=1 Tax=Desulfosalsimonas propionicica TaxID=332175 RepID=A0A7W0CBB3_9BACT|nr:histidinol-phosphatase [Desulfosalsimonas propionicica]MBA2882586.1 histidinol-phosphatase (PHP family) [Desulfosalsimonas propionicica]